MTRALHWTSAGGFASVVGTRVSLLTKPDITSPAVWEGIDYADGAGTYTLHDAAHVLDAAACAAIEAYLVTLDGFTAAPTPRCYGVGIDGSYLGLVDLASAHSILAAPMPDGHAWMLTAGSWNPVQTLAHVQADALAAIDNAAGSARMRYITDVPGQQATYQDKAREAAALIAAPASVPGQYVLGEAAAMGVTPLVAAQAIAAVADQWRGTVGPAIEQQRRAGKIAVGSAATITAAIAARATALAALAAI